MSRADDIALWHEVKRSIIGLFAKRVRRADRLELAREMIDHSDELTARAERLADELAVARWKARPKAGERPPRDCARATERPDNRQPPAFRRFTGGCCVTTVET